MITSIANNVGIPQVRFKDYQTETFTVLQGKFEVDPTSEAWKAASQIVFEFENLVMDRSSIAPAYLIDSHFDKGLDDCNRGTVLKCWIKKNKLYIEKTDYFDEYGPLHFYIAAGFAKGGQRVQIEKDGYVTTGISNNPSGTTLDKKCLMVKEGYIFLQMLFEKFYGIDNTTEQAFDITGMPSDVDVYFPVVYPSPVITKKGSPIAEGHIGNGHLTCTNPDSITYTGNDGTFIQLFAVRNSDSTAQTE